MSGERGLLADDVEWEKWASRVRDSVTWQANLAIDRLRVDRAAHQSVERELRGLLNHAARIWMEPPSYPHATETCPDCAAIRAALAPAPIATHGPAGEGK